ncbi:hypothetical protein P171DRAFT_429493 [Karstenula rhodostoma CBS 690.94]|uniref:Uncharacterized protein n=1 Tax=Karstenula rhodostoma CBS 690.94 TaxID=1392251 RepID=A0A9P4PMK3_9PLEO|nr:hypothetical protein P171DRAFT_429493 [Karstenula rhodostoma CBS 690.94]
MAMWMYTVFAVLFGLSLLRGFAWGVVTDLLAVLYHSGNRHAETTKKEGMGTR